jgi:hypothetical protein
MLACIFVSLVLIEIIRRVSGLASARD